MKCTYIVKVCGLLYVPVCRSCMQYSNLEFPNKFLFRLFLGNWRCEFEVDVPEEEETIIIKDKVRLMARGWRYP